MKPTIKPTRPTVTPAKGGALAPKPKAARRAVYLDMGPTPELMNQPAPLPGSGLDAKVCPRCTMATRSGWGFAYGGGMGRYVSCSNPACDWHFKQLDPPDDMPDGVPDGADAATILAAMPPPLPGWPGVFELGDCDDCPRRYVRVGVLFGARVCDACRAAGRVLVHGWHEARRLGVTYTPRFTAETAPAPAPAAAAPAASIEELGAVLARHGYGAPVALPADAEPTACERPTARPEIAFARTKQCEACPFKLSTKPGEDIEGGYQPGLHARLLGCTGQIGAPLMGCHESPPAAPQACVGWLDWALNQGNGIAVRLAAFAGRFDPHKLVLEGPQHETLASMVDSRPREPAEPAAESTRHPPKRGPGRPRLNRLKPADPAPAKLSGHRVPRASGTKAKKP